MGLSFNFYLLFFRLYLFTLLQEIFQLYLSMSSIVLHFFKKIYDLVFILQKDIF